MIIESTTYWFSTEDLNEAYYLACILNSRAPNELMKDFQATGLFGARHVHKKILDIYYPRYNESERAHRRLAELGAICHAKTQLFLDENPPTGILSSTQLGRLRVSVKRNLEAELKEIEEGVKKVLG